MLNSLNAGVSGLQQFQSQIDLIGNNIANVNTTGFKSARVNFADTFVEAMSGPGMADASSSFGSGVVTDGVMTSFKGGSITATEKLILLAPTRSAYGQLSAFISTLRRRSDKGRYDARLNDFNFGLKDCIAL